MLTPNELVLTFGGCCLADTFSENRSRNETVRVHTDRQTHKYILRCHRVAMNSLQLEAFNKVHGIIAFL